MVHIYVLTNNKTPFYVGYTKNPIQRLSSHKLKYGTNIEIEILETCPIQIRKIRENHWIEFYLNSNIILLNKNKGGGGPIQDTRSEETKTLYLEKRKNWSRKGIPQPPSYKDKISKALMYKDKPEGFGAALSLKTKGKPKPEGFGDKVKESRLKPINSYKPINQLTLEGEFIKKWDSIKICGETLNVNQSSISKVCRGKLNSTGGFKFEFIEKDFRICRSCDKLLPLIYFSKNKSYCRECVSK